MPSQDLSPEELRILKNAAVEQSLVAVPYYDNQRVGTAEIPISDGELTDDGSASITRAGKINVPDAEGIWIPRDWADALSPFGAHLQLFSQHKLTGSNTLRIPVGWYRVEEIPNYQEMKDLYKRSGTWVHRGALIQVKLLGTFADLDDDEFESPEQSPAAGSTWSEIARVANGYQITQSIPDANLPTTPITYEDSRLDAIALLAANIGGVPYETSDGTLSVRSKLPSGDDPVRVLSYGDAGGVLTPPRALSRSGFINAMIVRNEQGQAAVAGTPNAPTQPAKQVQGRDIIGDGALRWGGPMGRVPAKKNNPLVFTDDAARADARTELQKRLYQQTYTIEVSCLPDPTIIPGDVVGFDYFNERKNGTVLKTTLPHNGLQKLSIQIATGGNPWA